MSADRTAGRLLRLYPPVWRARYGDELEGLIMEMSGGRRVPWRIALDVAKQAGTERWRATVAPGDGAGGAESRARGGAAAVLWAWALFVIAGAIVAKTSEHWQTAAGGGHAAASTAFSVLTGGALAASVLVIVGIALALPAFVARLRTGDWPQMRRRLITAITLTVLAGAATAALVAWAHGLTGADRNGHDAAYTVAFVAWAAIMASALLAWTDAAVNGTRGLALNRSTLRVEARLAAATATIMATMTAATAIWWVSVASHSPAALTGGAAAGQAHASAAVPQLIAAVAVMVFACVLAGSGARRAVGAAARL